MLWIILSMLALATVTILEVDHKAGRTVEKLNELKAAVAASVEVNRLAVALIATLAAGKVNPADVQAMTDQLKASSEALAASVAANPA